MPTSENDCVNAHNVKIGNFLQKNLEFITENTIFATDKIFSSAIADHLIEYRSGWQRPAPSTFLCYLFTRDYYG